MSSGGGLRFSRGLARFHAHTVDIRGAFRDLGEQLGRIEPPERPLGDEQGLPDHAVAFSVRLNRLAAVVRSRTAANGDSIGFVVRRCFQCACTRTGSIFVRGLDQKTIERLNERARLNGRSLQQDVKALLERPANTLTMRRDSCLRGGGTDSVDRSTTLRSRSSAPKAGSRWMRSTGRPRWRRMPPPPGCGLVHRVGYAVKT